MRRGGLDADTDRGKTMRGHREKKANQQPRREAGIDRSLPRVLRRVLPTP